MVFEMVKQIKDWRVPIAQTFLPLLVIPLVLFFDVTRKITNFLEKANIDVKDFGIEWQIASSLGNGAVIVTILFFIYAAIRKHNSKKILKQNLDACVWHSYAGYWFCRRVLNYQTVSLIRVPIPMQFKLVWKELFEEYKYKEMEDVREKTEPDKISVEIFQADPFTSTVNLILTDTYPFDDWKSKIPISTASCTTIVIDRSQNCIRRYFSSEYIEKIAMAVHTLPITVTDINIFATINTAHLYCIVKEVFKTGARDRIKRIKVYQQTQGIWTFEGEKYVEIRVGE